MTVSVLPEIVVLFLLSFARLGTMVMLMPALGEQNVSTRIRLSLALVLSFVLYPLFVGLYPSGILDNPMRVVMFFFGEFVIGSVIGLSARLIVSALQIAGTTISYQASMALAQSFDPTIGTQGALIGNFLAVVGVVVVFAMEIHHVAIMALHDSYLLFPPGVWLPVGDVTQMAISTIAGAFKLGISLAAPFIVFGIVFNLGMGLLNRLMPQVQIFFIAMPANVGIALLLLMATIGTMMMWYADHLRATLGQFLAG
ncbi:MAG: flagellar biosynthetic protein FliR [Pseudomonadota bacterium]